MTYQTWYKTWSVKVDIKPLAIRSDWTNILHMTADSECCGPNTRIPRIMFRAGSTSMHIAAPLNGKMHGFNYPSIKMREWTTVETYK